MPRTLRHLNRSPWSAAEQAIIQRPGITEHQAAAALWAELGSRRSASAVGTERRRLAAARADMPKLTPWFLAATDGLPVREGRYQVRFCVGWRAVLCEWRRGAWWVGGGGLNRPTRVNLRWWPGFHWRGLSEPPNGRA